VTFDFERRCPNCGALLASTSRADRVFCSDACRMAAHRRRLAPQPTPPAELERMSYAVPPTAAEVALLAGITQAAAEDWRAAAWVLSRRWPERWSPAERGAVSSSCDGFDEELDGSAPDAA
jgi:hypothetical protein